MADGTRSQASLRHVALECKRVKEGTWPADPAGLEVGDAHQRAHQAARAHLRPARLL